MQAKVDCLIKENSELKSQVSTQKAQLHGMRALKAAAVEELVRARENQNKAEAISRKFHEFVGHPGDVVNKAQLYDKGSSQQGTPMGAKIVWFLVEYNAKMEKLLREMRTLFQPTGQQ